MNINYPVGPIKGINYVPELTPDRETILTTIEEFFPIYEKRPFDNTGGITFWSSLALFYFMKRLQPSAIIESGVWRGYSTWVIDQLHPHCRRIACDPVFMMPLKFDAVYWPEHVQKLCSDYSCLMEAFEDPARVVSFFDDHQNKVPRLIQSIRSGFIHTIWDDNYLNKCDHITFEQDLARGMSEVPWSPLVKDYIVFPPATAAEQSGPLQPVFEELPHYLKPFEGTEELRNTSVTYMEALPRGA